MRRLTQRNVERALALGIDAICQRLQLDIDEEMKRAAIAALLRTSVPRSLPRRAPELYADRPALEHNGRRENIIEFLRRVWKPWMDARLLTRADLRHLDPAAAKAVENWVMRYPTIPSDINLLVNVRTLTPIYAAHPKKSQDGLALR